MCKKLSCSRLEIYFYLDGAYTVLVIAALGRLAWSSSCTVSVCTRKDNGQTSYYRAGKMEAAGETGKKMTEKNRVAKKNKK